jgi:hypothetical protein
VTGQLILEALREGQKTTDELMTAAGVSRNAVLCALYQLHRVGHQVVNDAPRGAHAGGIYRLVYDRDHQIDRICIWPGCDEHLNSYNPGPYCLSHRKRVAVYVLLCFDAFLDRTTEVSPDHGQLTLV